MATSVPTISGPPIAGDEPRDSNVPSAERAVTDRIRLVDRLFAQYRSRLLSHVTSLMSSVDDAEEVVQEAYARLLEVETLDTAESRVRGYLFTIATHLAYDRFRARRRRGNRVDLEDNELPDGDLDPGHIVGFDQCVEILKQTLLEIKPRSRQVFLMRISEQLSYPDIAERLGISTRTVEREMRHVIDRCQRRLRIER